ncbi:MAG: HdeD family acid-resistance protein [Hyphomicrobiaceae bacterium]
MMNTMQTSASDQMPSREIVEAQVAKNRGWFIAVGIILAVTGTAAIASPLAGSLAVDMIVATVFTVAGIAYFAHAFGTQGWGSFAWQIIIGFVYLAAGVFLYVKPVEGVAALTAVIAMSLIFDGIVRTAVSIAMRRGPWGWVLASGILSIVLGVAVLAMPAGNAVLLIGLLVGINMLTSGMAFLMLAAAARDEPKHEKAV